MRPVKSDSIVRAVALLVCPNAAPLLPDEPLGQPWITWTIVTPSTMRSTQDGHRSAFSANVNAHHSTRVAAYNLASDFAVQVEKSPGLVIPGVGVVTSAEFQGDPTEIRIADQSPDYWQFFGLCDFIVRPLS